MVLLSTIRQIESFSQEKAKSLEPPSNFLSIPRFSSDLFKVLCSISGLLPTWELLPATAQPRPRSSSFDWGIIASKPTPCAKGQVGASLLENLTHHAQHDPPNIDSCSIEPSDFRAKHLGFDIYWFISTIHARETDGLWDPTFGSLGTKVANTKHVAHIWSWLLKGHPILCSCRTIRIPLNLHLKLSTFQNSNGMISTPTWFPLIVGSSKQQCILQCFAVLTQDVPPNMVDIPTHQVSVSLHLSAAWVKD